MARATGLSTKQLLLLGRLSRARALSGFYLAGGGAVGWHFHHRRSQDLDRFSGSAKASLERVVEDVTRAGARLKGETDVMVAFEAGGIAVDVVRYPYPPLQRPMTGPPASPSPRPSTSE